MSGPFCTLCFICLNTNCWFTTKKTRRQVEIISNHDFIMPTSHALSIQTWLSHSHNHNISHPASRCKCIHQGWVMQVPFFMPNHNYYSFNHCSKNKDANLQIIQHAHIVSISGKINNRQIRSLDIRSSPNFYRREIYSKRTSQSSIESYFQATLKNTSNAKSCEPLVAQT